MFARLYAFGLFCLSMFLFSPASPAEESLAVCRKQVDDCLRQKKYEDAYAAVTRSLKLFPREPFLLAQAAQICIYLEKDEEASLYAAKAWKAKPWDAETAYTLANAFRQLDAYDKSIQVLETGLRNFPGNRSLRFLLGENYLRRGEPAKSEAIFLPLCRESPGSFMNWLNLMDAQEKQGKWQALVESGKLMEKAASALPVMPGKPAVKDSVIFARCLSHQARGYIKLARWPEAKTCLERVLRIMPLDRPTLVDHMMVCAKLNDKVGESVDRKKLSEFDSGL